MTRFAEALASKKEFVITCELIPGRGHTGKSVENILGFVEALKDFPAVHAVSLTDNPGGNPALSADVVGAEVLARGMDTIVHFSCKDMNRNFIESRAFALQRIGIGNLLVVSGDYPASGFQGLAKPVFDLDSVSALHYLTSMNAGLRAASARGETRVPRTDFFLGAAVSPFKWREASCVMQYMKLEKKIRAGARFIVTQLGYDTRKHIELLQYVREVLRSAVPVLGSVYVLTAGAADVMQRGEVPGCWVAPELAAVVREEARAEDKGRRARLERAARQIAVLRGLGYSGAHLEGLALKADDVRFIVERSGELASGWEKYSRELSYAPPDPFYYFKGGEEQKAVSRNERPVTRTTRRVRIGSPKFWILRALHAMFFVPDTTGYRMMVTFARGTEGRRGLARTLTSTEHLVKRTFLQCRSCDDCAAVETFYVCPEARCPKGMRQGPCGGSRVDEGCEVFPDRPCAWREIYRRAKNRGEVEKLGYIIPPRNWSLYDTGSWYNYFLGRDHLGHPLELASPGEIEAGAERSDPGKTG